MTKFCTDCGKEIKDGVAFCTECGTPAPPDKPSPQSEETPKTVQTAETAAPIQTMPPVPQPTYQQTQPIYQQTQTAYQPPQPIYQQQPQQIPNAQQEVKPSGGKYGVLSTGAFFGLMFLFAIPIIGWIACIITAFAPKNENMKHFARAMLIWLIIAAVLCVALFFLFSWLGGILTDYINEMTDGQFGDWNDIFTQLQNGDFKSITDTNGITME